MPVSPGGAAPVSSVFGRTGAVTLLSADVTGALGFTPANQAGDTVTGHLKVSHVGNASAVDAQYGFLANPASAILANYRPFGYKRQSDGAYPFYVDSAGKINLEGGLSLGYWTSNGSGWMISGQNIEISGNSGELRFGVASGLQQIRLQSGFLRYYDAGYSADPLFEVSNRGTICLQNTGSVPGSNPASGGYLYAEGGALKWRGSSGTVTTIAAA
jgi:hypothetical protein